MLSKTLSKKEERLTNELLGMIEGFAYKLIVLAVGGAIGGILLGFSLWNWIN